jgi:hypothetical protein
VQTQSCRRRKVYGCLQDCCFTKREEGWHQKKVDGFFHLGYVCLWSQTFLAIHLSALKSRNLFIVILSNFITASQILVGGLC